MEPEPVEPELVEPELVEDELLVLALAAVAVSFLAGALGAPFLSEFCAAAALFFASARESVR